MTAHPSVSSHELSSILNVAWSSSPLAQFGLIESYLYNYAINAEQSMFLDMSSQYVVPDINVLQNQVIDRIDNDIAITSAFNNAISFTNEHLGYSLRTNKMNEALVGARDIIADPISFACILNGEFPPGFEEEPAFPIVISSEDSYFGNSNNTFLSTALVETAVSLLGPDAQIGDLGNHIDQIWLDHSAIIHITPVNLTIFNEDLPFLDDYLANYTFSFSDETTPLGFTFVHSGYAFGGFRDEERYIEGKLFGPEDCSSWIAKLCNSDIEFSTVDLLFTYRTLLDGNNDFVSNEWLHSEAAYEMLGAFAPIAIVDPFTDILPGFVMAFRSFQDSDHSMDAGYSGHVALVLGVNEQAEVVTLTYTRDMPGTEGFGLKIYDYQPNDLTDVFFLEVNQPPLSLNDIFPIAQDDLTFWDHTTLPLSEFNTSNSFLPPTNLDAFIPLISESEL
tara:strand:+ start:19136 stop:20479 length:1344 start_codon:yes stop_codon:yes gene_type:complete